MSRTGWEMQGGAVARMRGAFEAHYVAGTPEQDQFSAAKARTLAVMERELEAAREVTFNRFAAGYLIDTAAQQPNAARSDAAVEPTDREAGEG